MVELAAYKSKPADGKLKDIQLLLHMMNGGKKGDPVLDKEDDRK